MTLERILQAARNSMIYGRHTPHCYSAWVKGEGYSNKGDNPAMRPDYLAQLDRDVQSEIENMNFASGYAEPGYSDPEKGVLFANWNKFPRNFDRILERAGYAIEWSDEWSTCEDCGKAIRTSGNSYDWQPYFVLLNECEIVCLDCIDWPDYLQSIEDNPDVCCVAACDPSGHGYDLISEPKEYENGWFPGQDDKPADILQRLHTAGEYHIVFRLAETSQFYVKFEVWQRVTEDE